MSFVPRTSAADFGMTWQDIKTSTDLPDPDLVRTLQSLACGKFRVLTKTPKSRDVGTNDTFAFNEGFTSPLARIKIMQVASRVESGKEREETQGMVDEERKHVIEVSFRVQHRFAYPRGFMVDKVFRLV
jgi:cullin 3